MGLKREFRNFYKYIKIKMLMHRFDKKIFLLGTPWYGNLGDQAITLGEKYLLQRCFKEYKIIEIPYKIYMGKWIKVFGLEIKKSDIIFLQGGGNLGSLYPHEEQLRRDVIKKYKENKIIIMPVSIFFHDNDFGKLELEKSKSIYNEHHNLTIISRDEISFSFAKKYFYKVNNVLAPDAAITLDGILSNVNIDRTGVQFFLREDIEKILSEDIINEIKNYLKKNGIEYNISDTTVPYEVKEEKREKEVFSRLIMAKKSRLVITDRYHGLIFAVITHTPVIVFKSYDTKISSGVKWFKTLDWVYYLSENDVDNIFKIIQYYCNNKEHIVENKTKCKELIINTIKNC